MPSRFVIRNYAENRAYHIFNRGVEKRLIYQDKQDYKTFLYYLYIYLAPLKKVLNNYPNLPLRLQNKNLSDEIKAFSYCLMPNHFHLLLFQQTKDAIPSLLKQLANAYTQYFNEKYERVGSLFQGRYKAAYINRDELMTHIVRYIHLNPLVSELVDNINNYPWSSYLEYIGKSKLSICKTDQVFANFRSVKDFKKFTLNQLDYAKRLRRIKHIAIEG